MIRTKKSIFLSLILNLIISISLANTSNSNDSIPLDANIRYGKLPNGLTYYIKPIDNPGAGLNIRLVVKAGIKQEKDGELDFAHITEHLGFVAGKNISRKKSTHLFDEAGVRLSQLNGFTAGNYTDYFVQVSDNNEKGISLTLKFFKDILWNLELNEKSIDLERITVFDETNGGVFNLGIHSFHLEQQITGWGAEIPEDFEKHIKTFDHEKLIEFYKRWYRPDLMAIVIVGNIDNIDKVEKEINEKFDKKKEPGNPVDPTVDQMNYLDKTPQFYKKELQGDNDYLIYKPIHLNFYFRQNINIKDQSNNGLKDQLIRNLFIELLNKKYLQVLQQYNTFSAIRAEFLNPPAALKLEIVPMEGLKKDYIDTALKTLKGIKQYGFSTEDFNLGKAEYLNSIRQSDTLSLSYWKSQIINHFVYGEALPENKEQLQERILQNLEKEEFHNAIKNYIKDKPEDISIVAYKGDPALKNPEKKIKNWINEISNETVEKPDRPEKKLSLMDTVQTNALEKTSVKVLETEITGAKSYQLKNGLRIILKDSQNHSSGKGAGENKIVFQGFSQHGIKCFPQEDYFSALNATEITRNSGVGKLNKFELERYLDRYRFKGFVSPYIENDAAGIKANIALKDIETALQLVYLYFTSPNFNTTAFEDWKTYQKIYIAYQNYPVENFESNIREVLPDNDFKPKGRKFIEGLAYTDLNRAKEIFNQIFNDAENFTFLFSGDFNEEEVLNLCRKYLGNLPVTSEYSRCISKSEESLVLPVESKTFHSVASLNSTMVKMVYVKESNISSMDWQEEIKLILLNHIMKESLMRRLRFKSEEGGTYEVTPGLNIVNSHNYIEIPIGFNSDPKDVERLIGEVQNFIEELKSSPVEISFFEKLKKTQLNDKISYGLALAKMLRHSKDNYPWLDKEERNAFINSLHPNDIQETANNYLSNKPIIFKMLPKENK
ncbi:M16 family metallopeptidase [Salegentibacter sp. UBA1130]|uniref:M16 family metallopeptidase n=1 Tax=Salegentibacter sp. UBA1130 TaxID=1947451 RepID=UPI00257B4850|nr:insulinase family protein [Salegentibacter sp. UBA1130]